LHTFLEMTVMTYIDSQPVTTNLHPMKWRSWWMFSVGIWVFPLCMLAVWFQCYAEIFGEPPCGPWAERTIDVLFVVNLIVVAAYIPFMHNETIQLVFVVGSSVLEINAATFIWFFGGPSVAGYFF
jgi:hypothetical protein